ncbi:MAG: hypothetical protein M3N33_00860 [Actinomycetota bacterium]|nr:hypothetical protein [Actinomycetota bacterium]
MEQLQTDLDPKQEKALAALLEQPTIKAAAEAAGVGRTTLHGWLNQTEFRDAYRRMQRDALDSALAKLRRNAGRAADVLAEVMDDAEAPASSRIAAADKTLAYAQMYTDDEEIHDLIRELRDEAEA